MSFDLNPPAYEEAIGERPAIRPLNFSRNLSQQWMKHETVTSDECIAHLKLLASIANLRDEVSTIDSLFGLHDSMIDNFALEELKYKAGARIREKRWAIYVNRAVDRFEAWWDMCISPEGVVAPDRMLTIGDIESRNQAYSLAPDTAKKLYFSIDNLPPLDVIMVWHAYMLNPRIFLDDCLRANKMNLWVTGMPWAAIDVALDNKAFDYRVTAAAVENFERITGRPWGNLQDAPGKSVECPRCFGMVHAPWFSETPDAGTLSQFDLGIGYADRAFNMACSHCNYIITHEALRVAKFRRDTYSLLHDRIPMPGTLLSKNGTPKCVLNSHNVLLPNKYILNPDIHNQILRLVDPTLTPSTTIADIRDLFSSLITNHHIQKPGMLKVQLPELDEEKLSFRRMMARYWTNSSPLGLDLVGAVVRQGTFVTKMDAIGWIRSSSLEITVDRLTRKYKIFMQILCESRGKPAVPTLDVDLAWHTHQLFPQHYYRYSTAQSRGIYINHDDKIEETKLSKAFEETSRRYQAITGGQIYSHCICWYCEAIREANNTQHGLLSTFSSSNSRDQSVRLHDDPNVTTDPTTNPHISAHSAIRTRNRITLQFGRAATQKLRADYSAARMRLEKRHRHRNISDSARDSSSSVNDHLSYYPIIWGYPIYTPLYLPYAVDQSITPELYAANPACMAGDEVGAVGACIAYTKVSSFTEIICSSGSSWSG